MKYVKNVESNELRVYGGEELGINESIVYADKNGWIENTHENNKLPADMKCEITFKNRIPTKSLVGSHELAENMTGLTTITYFKPCIEGVPTSGDYVEPVIGELFTYNDGGKNSHPTWDNDDIVELLAIKVVDGKKCMILWNVSMYDVGKVEFYHIMK